MKIEAVTLLQHKGLLEAKMEGLGRINVISGPNNSGKTTVLECLVKDSLHVRGCSLKNIDVNSAELQYLGGQNWTYESYGRIFKTSYRAALEGREVWYTNKEKEFSLMVQNQASMQGTSLEESRLNNCYKSHFTGVPVVLLVPAKRRLDTDIGIISHQKIEPSGGGILNYLFTAANQPDGSDERAKFLNILATFKHITGYEFGVFVRAENKIELQFRGPSAKWLKAEDCGLGFRDLIIILYCALVSNADVVLLEEPESHLHPDFQRKLMRAIRDKSTKQFFLSTHSNVFLSPEFAEKVFSTRLTATGVAIENVTSRAAALTDLGYSVSDNLISDLVILCEGPSDTPVIEEFLDKKGLSDKYRIRIWPLGGDIMNQLDLSVFKEAYRLVAIIDNDPKSKSIREAFTKKCGELGIPVTRLTKYAMENYFSIRAISEAIKQPIPEGVAELLPNKKVSEQLGFEVKRNNRLIARAMALEDIRGTDLEAFFNDVERMLAVGNSAPSTLGVANK